MSQPLPYTSAGRIFLCWQNKFYIANIRLPRLTRKRKCLPEVSIKVYHEKWSIHLWSPLKVAQNEHEPNEGLTSDGVVFLSVTCTALQFLVESRGSINDF